MQKASIETLTWKDVRDDVHKINPQLADAIDAISPNKTYKIYKVKYPFGARVFEEGLLNIPNTHGSVIPIVDNSLPKIYMEDLTYRTIPISFILRNSFENHFELKDRIIPLTLFTEGALFGAWEALDPHVSYFPKKSWNVTAGARSIFMLPKISDVAGNKRLYKEYKVSLLCPRLLKEHWYIFRDIINHSNFSTKWDAEILFFSKKWFNSLHKNSSWSTLKVFLYDYSWYGSMFWRYEILMNLVWQKFAIYTKEVYLKIDPTLLETLKHLVMIGLGALPSFIPIDEKELTAPIETLQKVFLDCYDLKYVPTIMRPHHFNMNADRFCYYSLREPTFIESTAKGKEIINYMQFTRELNDLFDMFKDNVLNGKLKLENTPMYNLIKDVSFDFFHTDADLLNKLRQSHLLAREDKNFMLMPNGYGNRQFCEFASFVKGCVRLSSNVVKP